MFRGADGKWRTMANETLYAPNMLIGALYRSEVARELEGLGYAIMKTHADGRFEIAGVSRKGSRRSRFGNIGNSLHFPSKKNIFCNGLRDTNTTAGLLKQIINTIAKRVFAKLSIAHEGFGFGRPRRLTVSEAGLRPYVLLRLRPLQRCSQKNG